MSIHFSSAVWLKHAAVIALFAAMACSLSGCGVQEYPESTKQCVECCRGEEEQGKTGLKCPKEVANKRHGGLVDDDGENSRICWEACEKECEKNLFEDAEAAKDCSPKAYKTVTDKFPGNISLCVKKKAILPVFCKL